MGNLIRYIAQEDPEKNCRTKNIVIVILLKAMFRKHRVGNSKHRHLGVRRL